jgi:hypothetical protein
MAHTDSLDSKVLDTVAGQIGERLVVFRPTSVGVTVHESFQLWLLLEPNVAAWAGRDLLALARKSDRWHHQLHEGGSVFGFARSAQDKDGLWRLHELFETPIAQTIDQAITVVDAQAQTDDSVVRLLFAPAYHLYALWLINEGQPISSVIVADAPSQFDLPRNVRLDSARFLSQIASREPIVGISR